MGALRFGVLGTGYWALETHAAMLAAAPDTELVAIWGRDPAKTEAAAALRGRRPRPGPAAGRGGRGGHHRPARRPGRAGRARGHRRAPPAARQAAGPVAGRRRSGGRGGGGQRSRLAGLLHPALPARWPPGSRRPAPPATQRGSDGAWLGSVFTEPDNLRRLAWRRAKGASGTSAPTCCRWPCPVLGPVERVAAAPAATPCTWSSATPAAPPAP